MKKFRLFIDVEKEEQWLDDMADKGWILKSVTPTLGMYKFVKNDDASFIPKARIDYRDLPRANKKEYMEMFEHSGWKNIYTSWITNQHYFIQDTPAATQDIFSDPASMGARSARLATITIVCAVVVLIASLINFLLQGPPPYVWIFVLQCICCGMGIFTLFAGFYYIYKSNIKGQNAVVTEPVTYKKAYTSLSQKIMIAIGVATLAGVIAVIINYIIRFMA